MALPASFIPGREYPKRPVAWTGEAGYAGAVMDRRAFLKTAGGAAASALSAGAAARRPNIVVIMADDMGFSDIGCYGGEIATPHLDSLARSGVRFTQFYNNAKCCPTRSALLTGLYNHQAGVGNMVNDQGNPSYQGYLNDRCVTIAEVLREAGYATLMAGKWHVGEERPHWPKDRGFDRYFGLISGSSNYYRVTEERPLVNEDKVYRPKDDTFYLTDLFTDHAVRFIDEYARRDQPFFLYTAYTSPHWPLHAPPEDVGKYRGKYRMGWDELRRRRHARQIEMGIVDRRWPLTPRDPEAPAWDAVPNKDEFDLKMAVYAAQIESRSWPTGCRGRTPATRRSAGSRARSTKAASPRPCSRDGRPASAMGAPSNATPDTSWTSWRPASMWRARRIPRPTGDETSCRSRAAACCRCSKARRASRIRRSAGSTRATAPYGKASGSWWRAAAGSGSCLTSKPTERS
jgi:hypothetical protein